MTSEQIQDAAFDLFTSLSETGPVGAAWAAANDEEVIKAIETKNEMVKRDAIKRQLQRLANR